MPKNKQQGIVFGILMSVFMTIGMEVFNNAIEMGYGANLSHMTYAVFGSALKQSCFMVIIVYILSTLYGNAMGAKFAQKHSVKTDNPYIVQLLRQAGTIRVMCPSMSLVATIIFSIILGGESITNIIPIWIGTVIKNFPIAFFWNMFGAAPLTHFVFSKIYSK